MDQQKPMMATVGLTFAPEPVQATEPRPERPRLKDLMRAERERQPTRRVVPVLKPLAALPRALPDGDMNPATRSGPTHRPLLKALMAEERARIARLRTKAVADEL